MTAHYEAMSMKELAAAYNQMAETAGLRGREVTQVKRFKDHLTGINRCQKLAATLNGTTGSTSYAANGKGPEAERPEPTTRDKFKFGHDLVITHFGPCLRHPGSTAARRYEEAARWFASHPDGRVEELLANTSYRRVDYVWDRDRGSIKDRVVT